MNFQSLLGTFVSVGRVQKRYLAKCPPSGLSFEQMFEYSPQNQRQNQDLVLVDGLAPLEFTFKGRRFRIHNVLNRWCEAGGWWNRISDGIYRPDDGARAIWRVEAAPIGAVTTFELEKDEATGKWLIRVV